MINRLQAFIKVTIPQFIAWHVLPKSVIYFSAIRLMAFATTGKYSNQIVPELKAMDALQRWVS